MHALVPDDDGDHHQITDDGDNHDDGVGQGIQDYHVQWMS